LMLNAEITRGYERVTTLEGFEKIPSKALVTLPSERCRQAP
jgi:hypothetical protein